MAINSDDSVEYYIKSFFTGFYNQIFRRFVLRLNHGLVFVTHELLQNSSFARFHVRKVVIANGIDVDKIEWVQQTENSKPQLMFIGSLQQSWHGVDKIKTLALLLSHCEIHVAGPDEHECASLWGSIPRNVIVHGYLCSQN